ELHALGKSRTSRAPRRRRPTQDDARKNDGNTTVRPKKMISHSASRWLLSKFGQPCPQGCPQNTNLSANRIILGLAAYQILPKFWSVSVTLGFPAFMSLA